MSTGSSIVTGGKLESNSSESNAGHDLMSPPILCMKGLPFLVDTDLPAEVTVLELLVEEDEVRRGPTVNFDVLET